MTVNIRLFSPAQFRSPSRNSRGRSFQLDRSSNVREFRWFVLLDALRVNSQVRFKSRLSVDKISEQFDRASGLLFLRIPIDKTL
jgi:hypothetical protein